MPLKLLLTEGEIDKIHEESGVPDSSGYVGCFVYPHYEDNLLKAQLKKVVEWGKEYCVWHPQQLPNGSLYANLHRRQCDVCWQALLDEVKDATE